MDAEHIKLEKYCSDQSISSRQRANDENEAGERTRLNESIIIANTMGPVRLYTCDLCGLTVTRLTNLRNHMEIVHLGLRPFQCQKCCRHFSNQTYLKRHMISHTKVKPFACDQCSKTFIQFQYLQQHKKSVHQKLRPYECQVCGRCYSGGTNLKHHMATHTGVRQYSCDLCDKSFTQLHSLKRHKFAIHHQCM